MGFFFLRGSDPCGFYIFLALAQQVKIWFTCALTHYYGIPQNLPSLYMPIDSNIFGYFFITEKTLVLV